MTREEAIKMLKAKLECVKRETSGTDIDCNHRNCDECNLCYEQGNMGEQKEALDMAIKTLEQQDCEDAISREQVLYEAIYYADRPTDTFIKDVLKQMPSVTPKKVEGGDNV